MSMRRGLLAVVGVMVAGFPSLALALDLDWSGQFRAELNLIKNYSLDGSNAGGAVDTARAAGGGYYISPSGSSNANFRTLFMRAKPKLIVNDNISIKSEWWVGDPIYGFFGSSVPYPTDQRFYNSTYSRGSTISAQRVWGEFLSDIGTVQVGRAPLHWGLGVVWHNGDGIWDRYQSTGDTIRLIGKFGSFSFIPSYINYSLGNSMGGSCTPSPVAGTACTPGGGAGSVVDYSIALKYENMEEDFDAGVNFIKRLAGGDQGLYQGPLGTTPSMNYNTWDLYAQKKLGKFTFGGEVPIVSGDIGGARYSAFALAAETKWNINETWETSVKLGRAPGQPSGSAVPDTYRAFYFHPNYRLGMIMFNYQFANFGGQSTLNTPPNTASPGSNPANLRSPYDNPIVNANYLSWGGALHADKWTFNLGFVYAKALETAAAGQNFFNTWTRRQSATTAVKNQESSLGFEVDWGAQFQWDEYFVFKLDMGLWFPGDYYKFSNTLVDNQTSSVFATSARVGVTF